MSILMTIATDEMAFVMVVVVIIIIIITTAIIGVVATIRRH
jgi:hypothetical protein